MSRTFPQIIQLSGRAMDLAMREARKIVRQTVHVDDLSEQSYHLMDMRTIEVAKAILEEAHRIEDNDG